MPKKTFKHILFFGDSLSERGTFSKRLLSYLTGFETANNRFNNGFAWTDHFISIVASKLLIKKIQDEAMHCERAYKGRIRADISDSIIANALKTKKIIDDAYNLDNDRVVKFKEANFVRTYCEGGLTSANYGWSFITDIKVLFTKAKLYMTRMFVSNLDEKLKQALKDDKAQGTDGVTKDETLVIEWSGGNDMITANVRPSVDIARRAVRARIAHMRSLIASGYKNFYLFGLPDLSQCPYFQEQSKEEQDNAAHCSAFFNQTLSEEIEKLKQKYLACRFDFYRIDEVFARIQANPKKYGFDPEKFFSMIVDEMKIVNGQPAPAKGLFFYDKIHPGADAARLVANDFCQHTQNQFKFKAPNIETIKPVDKNWTDLDVAPLQKNNKALGIVLLSAFRRAYMVQEKDRFFSQWKSSNLKKYTSLERVFSAALRENDADVFKVLLQLGWVDSAKQLKLKQEPLIAAYDSVIAAAEEAAPSKKIA